MTDIENEIKLLRVRNAVLDLKLQIAALRVLKLLQKYRADQPRALAGVPEGGQWIDDVSPESVRLAGKWDLLREPLCLDQLALDEELCRLSGSAKCWSLTQVRFAACMKDDYVPTLRH